MDPEESEKLYPPLPIELAPLPPETVDPKYEPRAYRSIHSDPGGPVPERPLHLCPTCDYILTGIPERRCPECGEVFTLAQARMRAIEKDETSSFSETLGENAELVKGLIAAAFFILALSLPHLCKKPSSYTFIKLVMSFIFALILTAAPGLLSIAAIIMSFVTVMHTPSRGLLSEDNEISFTWANFLLIASITLLVLNGVGVLL